jgi:hypothetical protein
MLTGLQPDLPSARARGLDFRRQKSYNRRNQHIAWRLWVWVERNRGWAAIGLMERDVAEIEFPKRPPRLDDILRRSLSDNYQSERDGAELVRYAPPDDGRGNGFDTSNHYEAAMNSGTNINLRRLQEQLDRQPLDEIAMLVRALTYGEMIELAEGMWKVQPDGAAVTQENLPALLHRWSQSRTVPVATEDYAPQDPDTE